jgi:hypothetical protein
MFFVFRGWEKRHTMSKTARRRLLRRLTILPWPERFVRLDGRPLPPVRYFARLFPHDM